MAELSYTQIARVTINKRNSTLKEILNDIESQTDYLFIYNNEVNINTRLSVKAKQQAVSNVLNSLLKGREITYSMEGNHIILSHQEKSAGETDNRETTVARQQKKTISGTVVDASGLSVIGANIVEEGTTNGTVTDVDGNFTLSVGENATIRVSYIGYLEQVIATAGRTSFNVTLQEDTQALDELVVVGYGTQRKVNLTGAVSSIKFDDVASIPTANSMTLLQGRLSGVNLTGIGAQPGRDNPQIRIRGVGTLSDNNDPMVLIDGVESSVSQIATIPASDIDNVSVLKDAASASIYGVRAANGVILITTKRGVNSRPNISYSGNLTLQTPTILPDFVDSWDWAEMWNEAKGTLYTPEMIQKMKDGSDPDHFANTKWVEEMFQTAPMHQHHLSVTGGSENASYMISAQYFDQEGILKETGTQRYNFRSNLEARSGILTVGLNLSGSKQDIDEPNISVTGEGLMRYLTWFTRPTIPVKYANGHYGYQDGTPLSQSITKNPIDAMHTGYKNNERYHFDGMMYAGIEPIKDLNFRTTLAYKTFRGDMSTFNPRTKRYNAAGEVVASNTTNALTDAYEKSNTYINENILTYNLKQSEHDLSFLLGHSIQSYRYDFTSARIENFPTENLYEINAGTEKPGVEGYARENSMQSVFGRINYNLYDRYLLELNIRHDGSSRFPKANRYATFPSLSAGWILSNESFLQSVNWLSLLKIRGSWGKLGNQEIGDYAYAQTLAATYNYYFGDIKQTGLAASSVSNQQIKWETTTITDIGFDASFFNGRVSTTFDWFDKMTSDILLRLSMPYSYLGNLNPPYQNTAKVRNRGWEFSARYTDSADDFAWFVDFNLSNVKNTIVDNKGIDAYGENTINREGYAISSYYGLEAIGIYRSQDDLNRTTTVDGNQVTIKQFGTTPVLGDIMYADTNNDGNINDDDRMVIGNPFPKMQYGFNLGGSWKNMDLSLFFQGVSGINRYNWEQTTLSNQGNLTRRWLDRYSADNTNGSMPRLGGSYNDRYSSFWLADASYLRLKNMEIGYNLQGAHIEKLGLNKVRLYLAGSNLLTLTSLENYDPEKTSGDARNDAYPNTRNYSFGVHIQF